LHHGIVRLCRCARINFQTRGQRAHSAPRFNLVSIVTDDQAPWTLGRYSGKDAVSPNLDRLAAEGARFTNAFTATPVCSPSRATFFTGRYGTQLGITDWITEQGRAR